MVTQIGIERQLVTVIPDIPTLVVLAVESPAGQKTITMNRALKGLSIEMNAISEL